MLYIYNYIFFKTFEILSVFDESPSFATTLVLCWLFLFNSLSVLYFLIIIDNRIIDYLNEYSFLIYSLLILISHLFYFLYRQRYLAISNKHFKEGRLKSILGLIGVVMYICISVWFFFSYTVPNAEGILE